MPYELIVRFCVTDDSIAADLEATGYKGEAEFASKKQIAAAFAHGLQCAADNGDLPDGWFAVDADSVGVCDEDEWTKKHLDIRKDPRTLLAEVITMMGRGMYQSSYESQMLEKLQAAQKLLGESQ